MVYVGMVITKSGNGGCWYGRFPSSKGSRQGCPGRKEHPYLNCFIEVEGCFLFRVLGARHGPYLASVFGLEE